MPDTPDVIGEGGDGGDGQGAPGGEGVVGGVEGVGGDGDSGGANDFEEEDGGGDDGAEEPPPAPPAEEPGDETEDIDRDAPGFGERRRFGGKPTGGAKGPEPSAGDSAGDPEEPAPAPASRSVLLPGAESGTGSDSPSGDQAERRRSAAVGDGGGTIVDEGDTRPSEYQLTAAPTQGGAGEGPDGATGGASPGTTSGTALPLTPFTGTQSGGSAGSGGAGEDGGQNGNAGDKGGDAGSGDEASGPTFIPQPVTEFVRYIPDSVKAALAALAALSLLLAIGYLLAGLRARRLANQRQELLQEVGLLQSALLPPVPEKVGALRTSVAYRPADGPGAGGDFYDVLPLPGGRVGFILGDVSGHGRGALARTAFMRYTLRAYLEAGLEPRVALQVAGRVIDDNLGGDFATVLLAVHDPETGSLTYATAGHPAPIVAGPQPHDPVTAGSSPPIGVGVRTGLRQTTVPLVPGSVACLFTDGLMEARTEDGILGRERLAELLDELGDDATARRLIESVASESSKLSDDMAAVMISPTAGVTAGLFRTEQLELTGRELEGPIARRFLEACGLSAPEVEQAEHDARLLAERFGGVVLHVVFGNRLRVEVLPRNVESIEAASRRVSAGTAR